MANEVVALIVWFWFGSPILGAMIGRRREAAFAGVMIGLLFGPLGVVAALGLDDRPQCSHCHGRLKTIDLRMPKRCPHCGLPPRKHVEG